MDPLRMDCCGVPSRRNRGDLPPLGPTNPDDRPSEPSVRSPLSAAETRYNAAPDPAACEATITRLPSGSTTVAMRSPHG